MRARKQAAIKSPSQVVIDRARKLRLEGRVEQVKPDETWIVRSDSGQIYAVMIWISDTDRASGRVVNVRCTCQAGGTDKPCCHALATLAERS